MWNHLGELICVFSESDVQAGDLSDPAVNKDTHLKHSHTWILVFERLGCQGVTRIS